MAFAKLLVKETETPWGPAGPESETVPVELDPPVTAGGLNVTDARVAGLTVKVADRSIPLRLAVMVAVVCELTPVVVTVKAAVDCPAGIVTWSGT